MKKIVVILLVILATTRTENSLASIKDAFLIGMLAESIPPVSWIPGLMCISDRAAPTSAVVGFVAGAATMALIQAALVYLIYKGAQSVFAQRHRVMTDTIIPK